MTPNYYTYLIITLYLRLLKKTLSNRKSPSLNRLFRFQDLLMQVFLEYCKMFFINAPDRTNKSKLYLFPSKPCFLPLSSRILLCTRLCIFFCKALNRDILNRIELSDKHSLENRFRLTIVEKIMI